MTLVTPASRSSIQRTRPVLGYFVLGSLILHALLVALWQNEAPAGPSAHSTFQVTVFARHGDAERKLHSADPVVPAHTRTPVSGAADSASVLIPARTTQATRLQAVAITSDTRARKSESRIETGTHRTERNETPSRAQYRQVSAPSGSISHGQHELSSTARYRKVRSALMEALLPHFDYPPVARRRGWQGRVNVGLHVEADGDLTRIRLVESSGHALLDGAAVRNVTKLRSIPRVAQWLEGNGMDVVLPVRYQLAD